MMFISWEDAVGKHTFQWHVGEPLPRILKEHLDGMGRVVLFHASGDELEHLLQLVVSKGEKRGGSVYSELYEALERLCSWHGIRYEARNGIDPFEMARAALAHARGEKING